LYLLAPVWMQLVHLLLADLLWIALVIFTAATIEKPSAGPLSPARQGGVSEQSNSVVVPNRVLERLAER
jgi:hypothetical protein